MVWEVSVLGLIFLLVLLFAGYVFAIRKIQDKRERAAREQLEKDASK